jgi:hypothetical protein
MQTAALVASVAGTAISAYSALQQGNQGSYAGQYNAGMDYYNAQVEGQKADLARERATADAAEIERQNRFAIGSLRANAGASGTVAGAGSNLEAELYDAQQGELNVLKRKWQGEVEAIDAQNQVNVDVSEGKYAAYQGDQARTSGIFKAASTLLTGVTGIKSLLPTGTTGSRGNPDAFTAPWGTGGLD